MNELYLFTVERKLQDGRNKIYFRGDLRACKKWVAKRKRDYAVIHVTSGMPWKTNYPH